MLAIHWSHWPTQKNAIKIAPCWFEHHNYTCTQLWPFISYKCFFHYWGYTFHFYGLLSVTYNSINRNIDQTTQNCSEFAGRPRGDLMGFHGILIASRWWTWLGFVVYRSSLWGVETTTPRASHLPLNEPDLPSPTMIYMGTLNNLWWRLAKIIILIHN